MSSEMEANLLSGIRMVGVDKPKRYASVLSCEDGVVGALESMAQNVPVKPGGLVSIACDNYSFHL